MPTTTQHAPGTFCWPELATCDYAGAKQFYAALFGWGANEQDIGGGEMYCMLKLNGLDVGALYKMRKEEAAQGAPPHWNSYVSVVSADDAAAKAKQLGGTVIMEPFDVFDAGRMAAIQDPTGAVFYVWQAKKHSGAGVLDDPGALCWTELLTRDADAASRFYSSLLPWRAEAMPMGKMVYTVFRRGDAAAAGMMAITSEMGAVRPCWVAYFAVADCAATAAKTRQLGGRVEIEPNDVPNVGRFAILVDPQGAHFGVLGPTPKA